MRKERFSIHKASNFLFPKEMLEKRFDLGLNEEKQQFGIFVFSDFCSEPLYSTNFKFSKKYIFFYRDSRSNERFIKEMEPNEQGNEWYEIENVEVCPFDSIWGLRYEKIVSNGSVDDGELVPKDEFSGWLSNLEDIDFSFPFLIYKDGMIAYFFMGNLCLIELKQMRKGKR